MKLKSHFFLIILLSLLFILPIFRPAAYTFHLLIMIFFYGSLTLSWNVLSGYTGYLSFGHAAFVGIASYVVGLSMTLINLPIVMAILLGGCITGLMGLIVGYACLRLKGYYFSIATLMLIFIGSTFFNNITDLIPSARTEIWLPVLPLDIIPYRMLFYYVFLAYMLCHILLSVWIEKSEFGYGLRVIKEDEDIANSLGVNTTKLKVISSVISAFLAGIVGATYAVYISYIDITTIFTVMLSFNMMFYAYFGGIGSWIGPLLATIVLIPVDQILTLYVSPELSRMSYGIIFIVLILLAPDGLYGYYKRKMGVKT